MTTLPNDAEFFDADDVPVSVRPTGGGGFEVLAWNSPEPRPYAGGYSRLLGVGVSAMTREEFAAWVRELNGSQAGS